MDDTSQSHVKPSMPGDQATPLEDVSLVFGAVRPARLPQRGD